MSKKTCNECGETKKHCECDDGGDFDDDKSWTETAIDTAVDVIDTLDDIHGLFSH